VTAEVRESCDITHSFRGPTDVMAFPSRFLSVYLSQGEDERKIERQRGEERGVCDERGSSL